MNETGEGTENEPKLKRRRVATNKKVNSTKLLWSAVIVFKKGLGTHL